ncbi:MAG: hypothetical protein AAF420_04795 [Pseudomonadota bacterium]
MSSIERDLDALVASVKSVAPTENAGKQIKQLIAAFVEDPKAVQSQIRDFEEHDTVLFEDDSVSIWHCRFMPGVSVPPHDHQLETVIGVYRGEERNDFYIRKSGDEIEKKNLQNVSAGQVLHLGPTAIHSVSCIGDVPCCGIHVYLGNLTNIDRNLFDVETKRAMPFTNENYYRLIDRLSNCEE